MGAEPNLSTTDKLLYLGRVAWSQAKPPIALRRLLVAVEHMRERGFPRGAVLAREGEPMASAYSLVKGRVRVSRRGAVLGEVEAPSLVGVEALLSHDQQGIGVIAVTDVLALELDSDTLLGFLGDQFPLVYEMTRLATRRLVALVRRLGGPHEDAASLLYCPSPDRRMNLVELILFLRTPGGPFERCSIDALADLAATIRQVPFEVGHAFWRQGDSATSMYLVVDGSVACTSYRDATPSFVRAGPGRPLGNLESVAGEPRWYDAVAETAGVVLELDVESLIDVFEDNVDVALEYLAWVSGTTLDLIERELGLGRDLLEFVTTFTGPEGPLPSVVDRPDRGFEGELGLAREVRMHGKEDPGSVFRSDDGSTASEGAPPASRLVDLVVFLDGRAEDAGTVEWAAFLAQVHRARLTGVFIEPSAPISEPEMFARGEAIREVIHASEEKLRRMATERQTLFESALRRFSLRGEWRPVHSTLPTELVIHAKYADMSVVARRDPSDERSAPPGLPDTLVLGAGGPIVVLPPRCPNSDIRRILVGWNASAEATRAVAGAMPLLERAETVEILVVDRDGEAPGHGQEPGADIAQHLARHGAQVEVRRLSCDTGSVGRVLLSRGAAFGAQLIVAGAYGHSRLRERVFGGVTRTLLVEAALPVLMCR